MPIEGYFPPITRAPEDKRGDGKPERKKRPSGHQKRKAKRSRAAKAYGGKEMTSKKRRSRHERAKKTHEFFSFRGGLDGSATNRARFNMAPNRKFSRTDIATYFRNIAANEDKINTLRNSYKGAMLRDFPILLQSAARAGGDVPSSRQKITQRVEEIVGSQFAIFRNNPDDRENERRMMVLWTYLAANGYIPNPDISDRNRKKSSETYEGDLRTAQNVLGQEIDAVCNEFRKGTTEGTVIHFPPGLVEYLTHSQSFQNVGLTIAELREIIGNNPYIPYEKTRLEKKKMPSAPHVRKQPLSDEQRREAQARRRQEIERNQRELFTKAVSELSTILGTLKQVKELGMLNDNPAALKELGKMELRLGTALSKAASVENAPAEERLRLMRSVIDTQQTLSIEFVRFAQ